MIIRGQRLERGFTILDNKVLLDDRLSFRARGVLAAILSRPDHWRTDFKTLAREGREGESAIRTALRELRDAGYLVQQRVQGERGRWVTVNVVYDRPQGETATSAQVGPSVGKPGVGKPKFGEPTPLVSNETNDCVQELRGSPASIDGLPAGSPLRDDRTQKAKKPKVRRPMSDAERQHSWDTFRTMDLEDLPEGREIRGAAWMELIRDHGAFDPVPYAQALMEKGQWEGFCNAHDLGYNCTVTWTESAA